MATKNKQIFSHFMIKEIHDQPEVMRNIFKNYLDKPKNRTKLEAFDKNIKKLKKIEKVFIIGCGTSYHAGLFGQAMIEEIAGLPVTVVLAPEMKEKKKFLDRKTLVVALSQSGETKDVLGAVKLIKRTGCLILSLTNNPKSKLAKLSEIHLPLFAGEEKAVAATKTFTAQIAVLAILSVYLGRAHGLKRASAKRIIRELFHLPDKLSKILGLSLNIQILANKYYKSNDLFILGRRFLYPIAREAALKFKETSYTHAEGLAAGELEHGPLAAIDLSTPVLFFAPLNSTYAEDKPLIKKLHALKKKVIAITTQGNRQLTAHTRAAIHIPKTLEALEPLLAIIPLQLLAFHFAVLKGVNPDKPRHLTKFVK